MIASEAINRFPFLSCLSLTLAALAISGVQTTALSARDAMFKMASIGDSWAAGAAVPYSEDIYDDNPMECLRNKRSWEALMAKDGSWTDSAINFTFVACSGARLRSATIGDDTIPMKQPQLGFVGAPRLLTMELGGNDCQFGAIARYCIYGLGAVSWPPSICAEYPDSSSWCTSALQTAEKYILSNSQRATESLYFDHHKTLQDIMDYPTIKGRDDFYLYIVGYAAFFNNSTGSDWCNDQSFGELCHPKLTHELRSKMNELVYATNSKIAQSVKDMNNDHIVFIDPSPLFEGHRFCEPGHTLTNQYFLNDVWLWNLSPPELDPDYGAPLLNGILSFFQERWVANHTFPNGTQATQDQIEAMLGSSGSTGRPFHPKVWGHSAIKDAVIAELRKNKVPGVKLTPPTSPPKQQPYASGQVHMHVDEYWSCLDNANNLSVEINITDSKGTLIGYMPRKQAGASASARMGSKFEDYLIVTPEWARGGYVQFSLGGFQFNTADDKDKSKPTYCIWGGYNPKEGPKCWIVDPTGGAVQDPDAVAINQIDCYFPAVSFYPVH
jgi:hypothetical protein